MNSKGHIEALLREARGAPAMMPSSGLVARVLADAAEIVPAPARVPPPKRAFWARMLVPIGGPVGALALAACAAIGVFMGADYADEMLSIPGFESVLAGLTDYTDSTTPFDTLTLLMTEG